MHTHAHTRPHQFGAGCEAVLHTASVVDLSPAPTDLVGEINVDGTTNVIKAAQATPSVTALIYTSCVAA